MPFAKLSRYGRRANFGNHKLIRCSHGSEYTLFLRNRPQGFVQRIRALQRNPSASSILNLGVAELAKSFGD